MTHTDFDQVLDEIDPFGPYQIYNMVLLGLAGLPVGAHCLANVFLAGLPDHSCTATSTNATSDDVIATAGEEADDVCYYAAQQAGNDSIVMQCSQWEYDDSVFGNTMASEWNLVCDEQWKLALSQSTFMLGFLIGCVCLGNMSDILGRKVAWYLSLVLMIVSGSSAAFMPNYWLFVTLRLLVGAASTGVFTCGFVITMETIGCEHRMKPGVFYQGWPAAGYMLLALVAYFIRDYRYLQLFLGLCPIVFLPYWILLGESPRWLLAEGRSEDALKEIKKAARMNKKEVPESLFPGESKSLINGNSKAEKNSINRKTYTVIDLVKTPNMRRKTLNSAFNWFVNSLVYYGLTMSVGDLPGGPYVNLFLSGLMEFPSFFIAVFTLDRFGRRFPLAGLMLIGGLCCLGATLLPQDRTILIISLAMLGKLGISGSFAVIYVFSAELFPTVVRNLGVGCGSMCARVGSLISPFVMMLGIWWKPLPMIIFGSMSIIAGLMSLLLPETLGAHLPDTLQDGEQFGRNSHKNVFDLFKSRKSGSTQVPSTATDVTTMTSTEC